VPPGVTVFVGQPSLSASDLMAPNVTPAPSATRPTLAPSSSAVPSTTAPASTRPAPGTTTSTSIPKPAPVTSTATSAPSGAKLVFDDEFNGTSVDRSKWNVRDKSWASNELSIDTARASNVSVGNGVLTLRAQRERYTAYSMTRDYTSGYLDTIGLMSRQYGRWEMRAKLPTAKGLWPAFWLRSDHSPGEVDILEAIGGLPQMTVQTAFPDTNDGSVKKSHLDNLSPDNGITGWHVYGFSWTPTAMTWDIDGVTAFRLTSTDVSWVSSAFTDTMNIRLNLQVGGSMPNYFSQPVDSSTQFPAEYQIDYVRVYDR
jgi:beta-glucanase (GH16 family)